MLRCVRMKIEWYVFFISHCEIYTEQKYKLNYFSDFTELQFI